MINISCLYFNNILDDNDANMESESSDLNLIVKKSFDYRIVKDSFVKLSEFFVFLYETNDSYLAF